MTQDSKSFKASAHGGGECDNTPRVVSFSIDAQTAQTIITLSELAKTHDLHKLEKFDYRARFLQYDPDTDPEDAAEAGEDNDVRTECDVLVVEKDEFFFSAYIKHTDIRVSCEGRSIAELVEHFGLKRSEAA